MTSGKIKSDAHRVACGHQFGDTFIDGYKAIVIQGDFNAYMECPSGEHQITPDVLRSWFQNAGGNATQQNKPLASPSVSRRDARGNIASQQPVERGTDPSHGDFWEEVIATQVNSVRLIVGAKFVKPGSDTCQLCGSYFKHPILSLETQPSAQGRPLRRLKVSGSDCEVLWLPETRIGLRSKGRYVKFRFSNCNRLERFYIGKDNRLTSFAAYNPEDPNVQLEIEFEDSQNAEWFKDLILCKEIGAHASSEQSMYSFQMCSFAHLEASSRRDAPQQDLRIWTKEEDPKTGWIDEEHDYISFAEHFDLEIDKDETQIFFRYVNWIRYRPVEHSEDLPQFLPQSLDGSPNTVLMDGGQSSTSTLSVPIAKGEVKELLNKMLMRVVDWYFELFIPEITLKIFPTSKISSLRKSKRDECTAQMTIWSRTGIVKMLMRRIWKDEEDSKNNQLYWFAITLDIQVTGYTTSLKNDKDPSLVFKNVECKRGNFVSTRHLEPETDDQNLIDLVDDDMTVELSFSRGSWSGFRRVVGDEYLHLESNS